MHFIFLRWIHGKRFILGCHMVVLTWIIKAWLNVFAIFYQIILNLKKELYGKVKYLIAVESMDFGYYKITLSDNKIIELEESLLYEPRFDGKIGKLIKLQIQYLVL